MSIHQVFFEEWEKYHQNLVRAVKPLTADQLDIRPSSNLRSVREITQHIVAARAWWFRGFMGEGSDVMTKYFTWDDPDAPVLDTAEIVRGLEATWALVLEALERWNESDMAYTFPHEWRGNKYDLSRSWVTWHVMEHDLHHGGELSIIFGMNGIPGLDV